MGKIKCFAVEPKNDMQEVRSCLDANGISYSYDNDDNIIFANLEQSFPTLDEVANVKDPVFIMKEQWFFQFRDDVTGPYDNEDKARSGFVRYISWSGEFVNNAHSRNDA